MANNGDAPRLLCQTGANNGSFPWYFARFRYPRLPPGSSCPNCPVLRLAGDMKKARAITARASFSWSYYVVGGGVEPPTYRFSEPT
jgi:hypothetical protein